MRRGTKLDDLEARVDAVEAQVRGDTPAMHTLPPSPIDPEPMVRRRDRKR